MQARGDDVIAYYAADLGKTRELALTNVSAQLPDAGGPLPPGRYLIHLGVLSALAAVAWVKTGPFDIAVPLVATAAVPCFPMTVARVMAIEINVRKGHNDRVAAIMDAAFTGTLYVTAISRAL